MKNIYEYAKSHEAEIKEALKAFIEKTNGKAGTIGMTYDGKEKYGYPEEDISVVFTHTDGSTYNFDDNEIDSQYKGYLARLKKCMKAVENGYVQIGLNPRWQYYNECMALLNEVQKRCSARTIGWYSLNSALGRIEEKCPINTKMGRKGLKFSIDPNGQEFPKAYKYTPESTIIHGEFTRDGMKIWFAREESWNKTEPEFYDFSEDQILEMLKDAGVDVWQIKRIFNYYKNGTGKEIKG